jgi:PAS domain S-box-containing protein
MKFLLYRGVFLGFLINFIILFALGWVAYTRSQLRATLEDLQSRKNEVALSLERTLSAVNKAQNYAKAFYITEDPMFKNRFDSEVYEVQDKFRKLSYLLNEDPDQRAAVSEFERLINKKVKYHSELIELVKYRGHQEARKNFPVTDNLQINDDFEEASANIKAREDTAFLNEQMRLLRRDKWLQVLFTVLFTLSLLLLITVFFIIRYHLRGRVKAETLLEGNEQIIRSIIDRTSEPIFMKEIDGQYIMANKQFEELFHKSAGNIKGKTDHDLFPKEIADKMRSDDLDVIKSEKEIRFEETLPHNGQMHTYILVKFPLRDLKNTIYGVGAIAMDISEQKNTEVRLKESEALIQTLFDIAPEAVIMMDQTGNILKWNRKAEQIFLYNASEVLGKPMHEMILPERYWDSHVQGMKRFLETGDWPILNRTIEISAVNENKVEFDIELSISSSHVKGHHIFVAFAKDISGRKKLERENQENKNFLSSVVDNIPDMIFVKDAKDLKFVTFNKAGERLLGFTKKEMMGKSDFDFFPKEQAEFFAEKDKQVLEKGELVDIREEEIDTKNGKRWLHTKKIPILDENGKPKFLLGISSDITTRKILELERDEAAKKLRENEKRISLILENIGEGVVVSDTKKRVVLLNQMAEEILELTNIAGATDWSGLYDIYYPDGRTVFPAQNLPLERALRGEPTDEEEILIRNPDTGQTKLLKVNGRPIFDERGNLRAAVATIKDTTKYKEMERALEESEMKYRRLIGFKRDGDPEKKDAQKNDPEKKGSANTDPGKEGPSKKEPYK